MPLFDNVLTKNPYEGVLAWGFARNKILMFLTSNVSAPSVLAILQVPSNGICPRGFLFTSCYNRKFEKLITS